MFLKKEKKKRKKYEGTLNYKKKKKKEWQNLDLELKSKMAEGIHVPFQEFIFTPATHSKKDRVTERQLDQMKQLSW